MNGREAAAGGLVSSESGSAETPRARAVPVLALKPVEAAAAIGVSREFFDEHVKPELRVVRKGRLVLVPVVELERWLDACAERTLL